MFEVVGIIDGWKGLIEVKPEKRETMKRFVVPLDTELVRTWDRSGGTRLGTSLVNPFDPKKDQSELMIENIKKLGLDALVVIGGFDSLGVAYKLFREGIRVVGIPKTIDRDLAGTDYSIGFETAVSEARRATSTANAEAEAARNGIGLVKLMGRESGYIAAFATLACSEVNFCLVPEMSFTLEGMTGSFIIASKPIE